MTDDQRARDYLDGWSEPEKHAITIEQFRDLGFDANFRAVCSCGWQDLPVTWSSQAARICPVLEALQERKKRMTPCDTNAR